MTALMWSAVAFVYFGRGELDITTTAMALVFTAALGIVVYGAWRTGINN